MSVPAILAGRRGVFVLQHLYGIVGLTCNAVCDMSVTEYAFLLEASEHAEPAPLKGLERSFSCFKDPQHIALMLPDKELAVRKRSQDDRRGFALEVTPKGLQRLGVVDEAVMASVIDNYPRLTEEELGYFVVQMQAASLQADGERRIHTMIPADVMVPLCRFHRLSARLSSQLGLPPLQMAMLCEMSAAHEAVSPDALTTCAGMPKAVTHFQLQHLAGRHLVRRNAGYELTDEGEQRVETMLTGLAADLEREMDHATEGRRALFHELIEYAIYLFG